ncbi:MAG: Undecaprenyl phosphate-alpha-4-amino-4-deoxy-L-arabinose arabinosyl transferase [Paracidovorax wautersii]|uniref:Undecaprenyl phosphate-alpha-4-amino-4-deoxy-L-arabinose arabinosyl transferase n=1 Tax=Paracidovorax wautersii TaxID=1177982 RepID=A0A7V8FNA0_9BURK|nr:MAG: Undecaprenyl phosphate-alpha-4-amino-4-deoxy-L-arabinose arabinosyl transferase [Paracidovorax wautersii]
MNTRLIPPGAALPTPLDRPAPSWRALLMQTLERPLPFALLAALWLMATLGARPLMLPDEGRYVGVAWEMLHAQDWWTPTLNGLPFFHKPPLFYWITAGAMQLFGPHEWAARLAPLLGGWMAAVSLHALARRWSGAAHGAMAGVVLLAMPLFYFGAQFANLDMLVAGCITTCIALAAHAVLLREATGNQRAARLPLLAAYAVAALGVLAKGLIGIVLPGLVIVLWLGLRRDWRGLWALVSLPGLLLFALIAVPWFVVMEQRFPGFLHYFFVVQHFQRFSGSGFNNVMPFWFYPAVLLLVSLPWLPALRRPRRAVAARSWRLPERMRLLAWIWLVVVVLFFSMPHSKLLGYVLPAVPALAYLLADGILAGLRQAQGPVRFWRHWQMGALLSAALGVVAVAWVAWSGQLSSNAPMGSVLRVLQQPGDPVVIFGRYPYDLRFYNRASEPAVIVGNWADPDIPNHDDWRKEIADAAQFAPAMADRTLVANAQLPERLHGVRQAWLVGPASAVADLPPQFHAERVFQDRSAGAGRDPQTLWRLSAVPAPQIPVGHGCNPAQTAAHAVPAAIAAVTSAAR